MPSAIPAEMSLPKCSVALSRFNYAVLVKEFGFAVGLGIEQRDAAIKRVQKVLQPYFLRTINLSCQQTVMIH